MSIFTCILIALVLVFAFTTYRALRFGFDCQGELQMLRKQTEPAYRHLDGLNWSRVANDSVGVFYFYVKKWEGLEHEGQAGSQGEEWVRRFDDGSQLIIRRVPKNDGWSAVILGPGECEALKRASEWIG